MTYVDGFLLAAPTANEEPYRIHAEDAWPHFAKHGALTMVEGWGDVVPEGKINSIHSAVLRREGETPLFSWITWPDKATRDAGMVAVMEDIKSAPQPLEMPFDGQRMIFGGFEVLHGDPLVRIGYLEGSVMPVPAARRAELAASAARLAEVFKDHGATTVVDCWGDDVPEGKVNSFHTAILREPDEAILFSWINFPDKETRDAAWPRIMADPRMKEHAPDTVGADLRRAIFGGFRPLVDVGAHS
ncbi:MAG: DUF1428 domain-containing protein [Myxococcales bacterium]|nr:DUF1428 domain-containing protein [Myxococcales bacterium]